MRVLSIDIGATSGRIMSVSLQSNHLSYEEVVRFKTPLLNVNNELRWNINELVKSIIEGIKEALDKYNDISSIGIDTWGVDYCYIKRDGTLLENPFCYRDSRTYAAQRKVQAIIDKKTLYGITGIQDLNFNTIYQLYDDFHSPTMKGKPYYKMLMIPDYIAYCLTGEARLEVTNASTTGLLDARTLKPSSRILDKLYIPSSIFPDMIMPGEKYGYLKSEYSKDGKRIPVIAVCSHDTASAVLATPKNDKSIYISSGTWSLVGVQIPRPLITDTTYELNFTNEIGYKKNVTFLKNAMGMFLINELRNEWAKNGEEVPLSNIKKLIEDAPEVEKYLDVDAPDFQEPFDMVRKVRYYFNKKGGSTPIFIGQWIKLVYESMAFKYRYIIESLSKITGIKYDSIVIAGGGVNADVLNEYVANATGLKVLKGPSEATLLGNAIAQFVSNGYIREENIDDIVDTLLEEKVFVPKDKEEWDRRYKEYLDFIK